jgi:hypothetical protein
VSTFFLPFFRYAVPALNCFIFAFFDVVVKRFFYFFAFFLNATAESPHGIQTACELEGAFGCKILDSNKLQIESPFYGRRPAAGGSA